MRLHSIQINTVPGAGSSRVLSPPRLAVFSQPPPADAAVLCVCFSISPRLRGVRRRPLNAVVSVVATAVFVSVLRAAGSGGSEGGCPGWWRREPGIEWDRPRSDEMARPTANESGAEHCRGHVVQ